MKHLLLTLSFLFYLIPLFAQHVQEEPKEIDYMVVYDNTSATYVSAHGGEQEFAESIVNSFNEILYNSHIDYRFRLVGTMHINTNVANVSDGLNLAQNDRSIENKRKELRADLVLLVAEPKYDNGNSGVAIHNANRWSAFSCVKASNAIHYSAAHEMGHNLGCYHAHNSPHSPAPATSTAAAFIGERYITIMCSGMALDVGRTYAPIFSGLESVYDGERLGSEHANNVAQLRHILPEVAHWGDLLSHDKYYVFPQSFSINKKGQQLTAHIYSSSFFKIKSNASWLNINIEGKNMNGYTIGDGILNIELSENNTGKNRSTDLTIFGDERTQTETITIIQSATNEVVGIRNISSQPLSSTTYNLWGQKTNDDKAGIIIRKGKKFLNP